MNDFELAKQYFLEGCAFLEAADFSQAEIQFIHSLNLLPDRASTLTNLSAAQLKLKKFNEAKLNAQQAIALDAHNSEAYLNLALIEQELKGFDFAIAYFDKAIDLQPHFAEAWFNKGNALHELEHFDEAIACYDTALRFKPDYAQAWSNKGNTLHELQRHEEAMTHHEKTLRLKPNDAQAWLNQANTLHQLKRFNEALASYDTALSLQPDYHEASWNKSLSLLLQGDFANGLPLYEHRWNAKKVSAIAGKRFFDQPSWLGSESLCGKTILLYAEQGLGDYIQFCRYAKLVASLGAKVILEVPASLVSLMQSLEGVSQLVIQGKALPAFDYQCPLLSLPLAFHTNLASIPADTPYLTAPADQVAQWGRKLGEKRRKRVGLVWSSMSSFKNDSQRSLALSDFVQALPLEGFEYICLQKEIKECDKAFFKQYPHIQFFGDELNDFSDTAALIENLDLVISTCTSIPHLSGALGKKTWVLLSNVPDWRWLMNREDSPWYPSTKLYRQSTTGDWGSVLNHVKFDLNLQNYD
jgi:tetratricopeptide (TPR) repeat protein